MLGEERDQGSVTRWLEVLRCGGGNAAAQPLWERYFDRLVHLARAHLRRNARGPADEEDVALSAFDSFCRGAAAGRFPQLGGRDDLWRLLVTITARKANSAAWRERRQKRGGGRVADEAALAGKDADADAGLAAIAGREPNPAFAALLADEVRRLLEGLDDDGLRQIALLRMEGYSNEQVAERLGCGLRSVERKLGLIRKAWQREGRPDDG
jgi:DNA-directed RNA polymerase specialized sigma24 family protein